MSEIITARDIGIVTGEIRYVQRRAAQQLLSDLIEIGRLLVEAKTMVPYGEWGKYLEENVDYSTSQANNLMKLYKEYGDNQESFFGSLQNSQTFGNLTYTQALALVALPPETRLEFAETHEVTKMSTRELEKAVRDELAAMEKERDEALGELEDVRTEKNAAEQQVEELKDLLTDRDADLEDVRHDLSLAQTRIGDLEADAREHLAKLKDAQAATQKSQSDAAAKVEKLKKQLTKAKDAEKAVQEQLKNAMENPTIPESVMEQMRAEVEAEAARKATEELQKQLSAAQKEAEKATKDKEAAEAATRNAEEQLVAAQKAAKMANPDVAVFKDILEQSATQFNRLIGAYKKVEQANPEAAPNCRNAIKSLMEKLQQVVAAMG